MFNQPVTTLAALLLMALGTGSLATADLIESFDRSDRELRRAGWRIPANATLVSDHSVSGGSALHLLVNDPSDQPKYAEYFLPVEPGRCYQAAIQIRTRGVARHPQGGRNRGAVLFLQLADRDRKYVAGGSFPAGLTGDQDWTLHRVISTNRIPENAAYLHVLIGIEGRGEAWFDALEVTEITAENFQGVAVTEPGPGAVVTHLRPTFTIHEGAETVRRFACRIELAPHPDFPEERTITEELAGSPHQLAQWLTPGTWHYRIVHHVGSVVLPLPPSRTLVIADDASAWPPVLRPQWSWQADARPVLAVQLDHPTPEQLQLQVSIAGQPAEVLERQGERVRFRPTVDLLPGAHRVRIAVEQAGRTEVLEHFFSNQQPTHRVTFREDRVLLIDGEPFYPLGTYRDPGDSIVSFEGVKAGGFNLTHDYLFEHAPQTIEMARDYLDRAHAEGLKVFMGIPRDIVKEQNTLWIQQWVAGLMDHPALLLWYLMDEPEKQGVSPAALRQVAETVRAIDPFHPTTVVYCMPGRFGEWAGAHDLHWNDPYPLPNRPMTWVEYYTRTARQVEGDHGPVWTVVQGFDYRYARNRERYRAFDQYGNPSQPTLEQTRFMTFAALAAGSDGLIWYWLPASAYNIREDAPETWQGIVDTVGLLKRMEPWLIAGSTAEVAGIPVADPFRRWHRQVDGRHLLVVMNASDQAEVLTLDLEDAGAAEVRDFESGEAMALAAGQLRLELAPWAVRIVAY